MVGVESGTKIKHGDCMTLKAFAFALALTFSLSLFSEPGAQTIWRVGVFYCF